MLHVFTPDTLPRVLDHPSRDLQLLGGEFLACHFPGANRIELRSGWVSSEVAALAGEEEADLIVLSWSQDTSGGHATVVRDVLSHSPVPVLLVPADADP